MRNTMSEEFLDWLEKCPCQWFLDEHEEGSGKATYTFIEEKED
jgi:hypothetical protein